MSPNGSSPAVYELEARSAKLSAHGGGSRRSVAKNREMPRGIIIKDTLGTSAIAILNLYSQFSSLRGTGRRSQNASALL